MKNYQSYLSTLFILIICLCSCQETTEKSSVAEVESEITNRQFFQLKTYHFDSEDQVKLTDAYLKDAYIPALKRLGVSPIGVFKPRPNEEEPDHRIVVLIPFNSLDQVQEVEDALISDEDHLRAGDAYINAAYDNPTFKRISSVLMRAFIDMPHMKPSPLDGPRSERIYELRSYESSSEAIYRNKVEMFNAGGEVALFDRIGSNAVFYGEVISGPSMPNLMYMTTYANQESRDEHWDTFRTSPEWQILKVKPEYQNNVSLNVKDFLYPTSYSDY